MRYGFYAKNNPHDFIELDLDHSMLEEYSVVMYDLKFKILRNGPEVDFDRIKLFPNKFEKKYLNSLRIWFLTEQDLVDQPGLASNLYMHFDREVSINNELLVTEYLLSIIGLELDKLNLAKEDKIKAGLDLAPVGEPRDIKEYRVGILLQMQEGENNILLKNKQFFETKKQELINKA